MAIISNLHKFGPENDKLWDMRLRVSVETHLPVPSCTSSIDHLTVPYPSLQESMNLRGRQTLGRQLSQHLGRVHVFTCSCTSIPHHHRHLKPSPALSLYHGIISSLFCMLSYLRLKKMLQSSDLLGHDDSHPNKFGSWPEGRIFTFLQNLLQFPNLDPILCSR